MLATLSAAKNPGIGAFTQHSKKKKGHRFSDYDLVPKSGTGWVQGKHGPEFRPAVSRLAPPEPTFQPIRPLNTPEGYADRYERAIGVICGSKGSISVEVGPLIISAGENIELIATARDWWNAEPPVVAWSDGVRRPVTFAAYRDALLLEREASAHAEAAASATVPPVGAVTIRIRNAYEKPWQPEVPDTEDEQETAIMAAAVMAMPLDVQNVTEANQLFKQIEYALAAFVEAAGVEILAYSPFRYVSA